MNDQRSSIPEDFVGHYSAQLSPVVVGSLLVQCLSDFVECVCPFHVFEHLSAGDDVVAQWSHAAVAPQP